MHSYKYNNQYCIPDELVKKIRGDAIKEVIEIVEETILTAFESETEWAVEYVIRDRIKEEFEVEE